MHNILSFIQTNITWSNKQVVDLSIITTRGHIHKAPQGKTQVKGNLWHLITAKQDNITNLITMAGCRSNSVEVYTNCVFFVNKN